jgi:ribosomal protein S21
MSEREFRGSRVEVRNGDIDGALRRLKRSLIKDGWAKDVSRTLAYEKPSEVRKRRDVANRKTIDRANALDIAAGRVVSHRSGLKHLKGKLSRKRDVMLADRAARAAKRR